MFTFLPLLLQMILCFVKLPMQSNRTPITMLPDVACGGLVNTSFQLILFFMSDLPNSSGHPCPLRM